MNTTLNEIYSYRPCRDRWEKGLKLLGKDKPDNRPLSYRRIINTVEVNDALWCLRCLEHRLVVNFNLELASLVKPIVINCGLVGADKIIDIINKFEEITRSNNRFLVDNYATLNVSIRDLIMKILLLFYEDLPENDCMLSVYAAFKCAFNFILNNENSLILIIHNNLISAFIEYSKLNNKPLLKYDVEKVKEIYKKHFA